MCDKLSIEGARFIGNYYFGWFGDFRMVYRNKDTVLIQDTIVNYGIGTSKLGVKVGSIGDFLKVRDEKRERRRVGAFVNEHSVGV